MSAETEDRIETVEIADLEYSTTCLFSIGWEQGDLLSTLIAPDGMRYPEDVPVKGITIAKRQPAPLRPRQRELQEFEYGN